MKKLILLFGFLFSFTLFAKENRSSSSLLIRAEYTEYYFSEIEELEEYAILTALTLGLSYKIF